MQSTVFSTTTGKIKPTQNNKNTGTLTVYEYTKMKEACMTEGLTDEQIKKARKKQELMENSQARVQNWPNTIEALRKKKDNARFERFKKEEEERRKIDQEEAEYQQHVKQSIIKKANEQIYETNDRVKALQSKCLLADVLKEREFQVDIKRRKEEIEKIREQGHIRQLEESLRADLERETFAKEEEKKKISENIKALKKQYEEAIMNEMKKIQEKKIEGEAIKKKNLEELEKQNQELKKIKEANLKLNQDRAIYSEMRKMIKKTEETKLEEEVKKIKSFVEKKEKLETMSKEIEKNKLMNQQIRIQKLGDARNMETQENRRKEDEILEKQRIEAELKTFEVEKTKKEKVDRLAKSVDKENRFQLKCRVAEKSKEIEDNLQFQTIWKAKNEMLGNQELEEKIKARERERLLSQYQKRQADEKMKRAEDEFRKELEDNEAMQFARMEDDKAFNSYAEKCLQEWADNGKNIKPLLLELKNWKKKIELNK